MGRDVVVLKWGGSLITKKSQQCMAEFDRIRQLARNAALVHAGHADLIVVHGAGSYGHIKAKRARLADGRINQTGNETDALSQDTAVAEVRRDMLELNTLVIEALEQEGLDAKSLTPHLHGRETGLEYTLPVGISDLLGRGVVPVLHGDVVDCDSPAEFGILSGDDICTLLCRDFDIAHLIFAMGGVDGLMRDSEDLEHSKLQTTHVVGADTTTGDASNDVTGGMKLKIRRAEQALRFCGRVSLVNGEFPERILNAIQGVDYIGTEIITFPPD